MHKYSTLALALGISIKELADNCGLSHGPVSKAIELNAPVSPHAALKICNAYPQVNINWLTGDDENILLPDGEYSEDALLNVKGGHLQHLIDALNTTYYSFEKEIGERRMLIQNTIKRNSRLRPSTINKIIKTYPNVSRKWLLSGEGDIFLPDGASNDEPINTLDAINIMQTKGREIISAFLAPSNIKELKPVHTEAAHSFFQALDKLISLSGSQ